MKKIVVYGAGDFADIMRFYLEKDLGYEVVGYTVDRQYMEADVRNGLPIIAFEKVEIEFSPKAHNMVIGIIGKKMFEQRRYAYDEIKKKGYELPNIIHTTASVSHKKIGDANIIMDNSVIGPNCEIGSGNIVWPCVSIAHQNIVGDFNQFAGCASTVGMITIGNHCFIGNNCTLNAQIADYTFIGAGAYISKKTDSYGVYTPARGVKLELNSMDIY